MKISITACFVAVSCIVVSSAHTFNTREQNAGLSRPPNRVWNEQRRLDNQGHRQTDSGGVLSHERMNGGRRMALADRNGNIGNGQLFERNSFSNQGNMVDQRQNNRNQFGSAGRVQNSQQNGQVWRQNNPNSRILQNSQQNGQVWRQNNPNSMIVQNSQQNGQVWRQNNPNSRIVQNSQQNGQVNWRQNNPNSMIVQNSQQNGQVWRQNNPNSMIVQGVGNRASFQQRMVNQGNQGDQGTLFSNLASHIRHQSPSRSSQGLLHSDRLGSQVIDDRRRGRGIGNSNMWRNSNANMNYVY